MPTDCCARRPTSKRSPPAGCSPCWYDSPSAGQAANEMQKVQRAGLVYPGPAGIAASSQLVCRIRRWPLSRRWAGRSSAGAAGPRRAAGEQPLMQGGAGGFPELPREVPGAERAARQQRLDRQRLAEPLLAPRGSRRVGRRWRGCSVVSTYWAWPPRGTAARPCGGRRCWRRLPRSRCAGCAGRGRRPRSSRPRSVPGRRPRSRTAGFAALPGTEPKPFGVRPQRGGGPPVQQGLGQHVGAGAKRHHPRARW